MVSQYNGRLTKIGVHLAVGGCLTLVVSSGATQGQSPLVVVGTVVDATTGNPLPGVNVFASGTTLGAATDSTGTFEIWGFLPGQYEVVASMVGYGVQRQTVRVQADPDAETTLTFALEPATVQLDQVVVSGTPPRDWRRHVQLFEKYFIGTTPNARKCELVNPEVLDFTYDTSEQRLEARAAVPLVMENHALGYRVEFYIHSFWATPLQMRWEGETRFTEMEPSGRRERRRWARNRVQAYRGSLRHFLAMLVEGRHEYVGFMVTEVATPGSSMAVQLGDNVRRENLVEVNGEAEQEVVLRGPRVLRVAYNEFPADGYGDYRRNVVGDTGYGQRASGQSLLQVSWLSLNFPRTLVHRTGRSYDEEAVIRHGYWSWERFAEELPKNFEPDER